jgi:hypothetical protein
VESYSPWRTLTFAAGTYVGRRFNTNGAVVASKSYTLGSPSAAPTTERSTIPNQPGSWYYITAGVWDGYWIQESAGTVLDDPPPPPPPPAFEDYDPPRTLVFAAGTHVGYQFTPSGAWYASKPYTLSAPSTAPTDRRSEIPGHAGFWYRITAGVWAGWWIQESAAVTLQPAGAEMYAAPQTLWFAPGTYVGHRFDATGAVTATKPYTLEGTSSAPTSMRAPAIPGQAGSWYYITAGVWAGYWIQESASTSLGMPPPPPPPPFGAEIYDPARTLWFAPGTYVGHTFDATGAVTGTKPYTLVGNSSAPTSMRAPAIPGQVGAWYYITAGVWAGYWIQESAGTTLP